MNRILAACLAAMAIVAPAEAAQVRYDFEGSLASTFSFGSSAGALETGAGLPGSYSGFAVFDLAAPDQDPDPDGETYFASAFGLTLGSYSLTAGDVVFATVNPALSSFILNIVSGGGFDPSGTGETLSLFLSFSGPFAPGVAQAPSPASGVADLTLTASDGSVLFAGGDVTRIDAAVVPEPSSWALMIGGLGLAGAALRRRRTQRVLA